MSGRGPHWRSARQMMNAIFEVQTIGCQWCAQPKALPLGRPALKAGALQEPFCEGVYTYRCGSTYRMGVGMFGWKIKRCQQHIFKVKPQTLDCAEDFAWLSQSRRLSKDYEVTALFS